MELDQVVFEYGRLQLNFVACQRQNTLLGTQLAQLNKGNAAITKDLGKALARVAQLEALIGASGVLAIPDPPKDPEETKPISGDAPQNAADLANVQAQTGPRGSRLVSVPRPNAAIATGDTPIVEPPTKPSPEN